VEFEMMKRERKFEVCGSHKDIRLDCPEAIKNLSNHLLRVTNSKEPLLGKKILGAETYPVNMQ
jgi:hypothetical protein